jgi:hypothetical protein
MPIVVLLACVGGISMLVFRVLLAHRPFRVTDMWRQMILATLLGWCLWGGSIFLNYASSPEPGFACPDLLCGVLILLCASWCNYWIANLGGGFRVQALMALEECGRPVKLEEWMAAFGGLGMSAFLNDRLNSILVPWRIAASEGGHIRLLPGWGHFFGRIMQVLDFLFYGMRGKSDGR